MPKPNTPDTTPLENAPAAESAEPEYRPRPMLETMSEAERNKYLVERRRRVLQNSGLPDDTQAGADGVKVKKDVAAS